MKRLSRRFFARSVHEVAPDLIGVTLLVDGVGGPIVEVEVPRVIGYKLQAAESRLAAQPLTPQVIYKPAEPKQRVDIVLQQYPAKGRLSSFDRVTLVMARATHGLVPRVMGLTLRDARARLHRLGLSATVDGFASGRPGRVLAQAPLPGVAAWPGMKVRLVVARG